MGNSTIKELIDLTGWKPSRCIHCVGWIKDNPERNKNNKYCNRCKLVEVKIWFIENKNSKSFKLKNFFKKIYCRIFKFRRL